MFGFVVDEFSEPYYKHFGLRARLFKNISYPASKIHRYVNFHKKLSLLFETSPEYLSIFIFGHKHHAILFNDSSLQVVRRALCDSQTRFSENNYILGSQKFFPFFHRNVHSNLPRMLDLSIEILMDFRTAIDHTTKVR